MIFTQTRLAGAWLLDPERHEDERGFFARSFCRRELAEHGLNPVVAQASVAFNHRRGTVRGMHFQIPPAAETKLVRCTRGALVDVIVDLRPESATYLDHVAAELTEDNGRALYVPERFAHGYQVLRDGTEASYLMGQFHAPEHAGGLHHADPRLGLAWPLTVTVISDRDAGLPRLAGVEDALRRAMAPG